MGLGQIWGALLNAIFQALQYFYGWVHDYGVAIILLTLAFRLVMTPLTWRQTKSMLELQKIQPKLKALQDKYKHDKEKQGQEMMKFYQENKVNPFGGCLPLLLQMPLFIALYQVLGGTAKNPGLFLKEIASLGPVASVAAKRFWILLPDLTSTPQNMYLSGAARGFFVGVWAALPYLVLVGLFAASVWLPQYLMTKDPMQRRTGSYMALVMLFFGFISPAGVLVYWVTSSAWQVVQQVITQRMLSAQEGAG